MNIDNEAGWENELRTLIGLDSDYEGLHEFISRVAAASREEERNRLLKNAELLNYTCPQHLPCMRCAANLLIDLQPTTRTSPTKQ